MNGFPAFSVILLYSLQGTCYSMGDTIAIGIAYLFCRRSCRCKSSPGVSDKEGLVSKLVFIVLFTY